MDSKSAEPPENISGGFCVFWSKEAMQCSINLSPSLCFTAYCNACRALSHQLDGDHLLMNILFWSWKIKLKSECHNLRGKSFPFFGRR